MAARNVVKIDADKCIGCGLCVNACAEGAIELINGKATVVKEEYCDGLGACLPACPVDAIKIERREAPAFDESAAMAHLAKTRGDAAPSNKFEGGTQARLNPAQVKHVKEAHTSGGCPGAALFGRAGGCPGAAVRDMRGPRPDAPSNKFEGGTPQASALSQWPVQLALVPAHAPFLKDADVVLTADCVPFAYADYHRDFLAGKAVLVTCPKLNDPVADAGRLEALVAQSGLRSLTVVRMEVPCCSALTRAAQHAIAQSGRDVPFNEVVISIGGERR